MSNIIDDLSDIYLSSTEQLTNLGKITKLNFDYKIFSINNLSIETNKCSIEIPHGIQLNIFNQNNVNIDTFLDYAIACINFNSNCCIIKKQNFMTLVSQNDFLVYEKFNNDFFNPIESLNKLLDYTSGILPFCATGTTIDLSFAFKKYLTKKNDPILLMQLSEYPRKNLNNLCAKTLTGSSGYIFLKTS